MPHLYVINSDFTKEEHLCWTTKQDCGRIILIEIVKRTYPHPDAPDFAHIEQIEEKPVATFYRTELEGSTSVLLEAAQNAVSLQMRNNSGEAPKSE